MLCGRSRIRVARLQTLRFRYMTIPTGQKVSTSSFTTSASPTSAISSSLKTSSGHTAKACPRSSFTVQCIVIAQEMTSGLSLWGCSHQDMARITPIRSIICSRHIPSCRTSARHSSRRRASFTTQSACSTLRRHSDRQTGKVTKSHRPASGRISTARAASSPQPLVTTTRQWPNRNTSTCSRAVSCGHVTAMLKQASHPALKRSTKRFAV